MPVGRRRQSAQLLLRRRWARPRRQMAESQCGAPDADGHQQRFEAAAPDGRAVHSRETSAQDQSRLPKSRGSSRYSESPTRLEPIELMLTRCRRWSSLLHRSALVHAPLLYPAQSRQRTLNFQLMSSYSTRMATRANAIRCRSTPNLWTSSLPYFPLSRRTSPTPRTSRPSAPPLLPHFRTAPRAPLPQRRLHISRRDPRRHSVRQSARHPLFSQ